MRNQIATLSNGWSGDVTPNTPYPLCIKMCQYISFHVTLMHLNKLIHDGLFSDPPGEIAGKYYTHPLIIF
jgi:hypothetical protein